MTTPTDPTNPDGVEGTDPLHATEARVRDALSARAASVEPTPGDPAALEAAIAADRHARQRRDRTLLGLAAAAAIVLVVVVGAALSGSDGKDQVVTGSDETTAPPATAPPTTAVEGGTSTSIVATTTEPAPTTTAATTAPPTTAPPTTAPPTTTVPVLPGATTAPQSGGGHGAAPALLAALRVSCNPGYDRVVFEFHDGALPGWQVHYVDPPITEDASGQTVAVAGSAYVQVRLEPSSGHDDQGNPTSTTPGRVGAGCASLKEAVRTGDFEAVLNWTLGVDHQVPVKVTTLSGPSRLVIDIAH